MLNARSADVGAQQFHIFLGADEFGVAAGGDGAARLLLLFALAVTSYCQE